MAQPLLQNIPTDFPDYRRRIEGYLFQWRQDLAVLEAGEKDLGAETGATDLMIVMHKRIIARYEAILAELDQQVEALQISALLR